MPMGNNPINRIDPTGHTELWVDDEYPGEVTLNDEDDHTYFEDGTGVRDYYEGLGYTVDWVDGTVVVTGGGGSGGWSDSGSSDGGSYSGGGGSSYHEPTKAERKIEFRFMAKPVPPKSMVLGNKGITGYKQTQGTGNPVLTKEQASKYLGPKIPILGRIVKSYWDNEVSNLPKIITYRDNGYTYTYSLSRNTTRLFGVELETNTYSYKLSATDEPPILIGIVITGPGGGKGRAANKLKPDPGAIGEHSVFKRDPITGKVTNYETYGQSDPRNPNPWERKIRYDGTGTPHTNPLTGERLLPHVHDKSVPGGVREPFPEEIP